MTYKNLVFIGENSVFESLIKENFIELYLMIGPDFDLVVLASS